MLDISVKIELKFVLGIITVCDCIFINVYGHFEGNLVHISSLSVDPLNLSRKTMKKSFFSYQKPNLKIFHFPGGSRLYPQHCITYHLFY